MFREIIRGRLLGHPVHAMLVHFPIGLFMAGACFDVASFWFDSVHLPLVAFYCIAGGLAGGAAAMFFGVIDYIHLSENERLFKKAGRHALLQVSAWLLFGVVLGMKLTQYLVIAPPGTVMLIVEMAAVGLMLAGNFIGGDLVYKDGVGRSSASDTTPHEEQL